MDAKGTRTQSTEDRIDAYIAAGFSATDIDEMAATFADEDERTHPGGWADAGFSRTDAISEYIWAIERHLKFV